MPNHKNEQSSSDHGVCRPSITMKQTGETSGFWEGEHCEYCGGAIVEKRVTLYRRVKGEYVFIEDVPAGVCTECGTRYYAANVLKTVEASIHGRIPVVREIKVPVYAF